jgi:hypothetical protein
MLSILTRLWPRQVGNGWFKPKVHEQLHVPRDIERNGSPRESYSGTVEHNHLSLKSQSKRTQRNRWHHDEQVGHRVAESYIIDYCFTRMQAHCQAQTHDSSTKGFQDKSSKGLLTISKGLSKSKYTHKFEWLTLSLMGKEDKL